MFCVGNRAGIYYNSYMETVSGSTITAPDAGQTPQGDCPPDKELSVAVEPTDPPRVGFDCLDELSINTLVENTLRAAQPHLQNATIDLAAEGGRGAAARRLLARDTILARARLRLFQGLRNHALRILHKGPSVERRVKVLERVIEGEHRRMLDSLEALARLNSPVPAVQIRTQQTAVLVERRS